MKTQPWLQGAGLALLYLLPPSAVYLSPSQINLYHRLHPVTTLMRGVLIDLVVLGLLCGAGFVLLDRASSRVSRFLWLPVVCIVSWVVARDVFTRVTDPPVHQRFMDAALYLPLLLLVIALGLIYLAPQVYRRIISAIAIALAAAGIALLVVVPRLLLASFDRTPRELSEFSRPVQHSEHSGNMRVVWILFDELSYNQAFAHPQPGITLPAFKDVERDSISFSHLEPIGLRTDLVLPSLLLGKPVLAIASDAHGRLAWRGSPDTSLRSFDPNATVFAAAKRQGWSTGVAGWYNPYCRILSSVLDRCYWTYSQPIVDLFPRLRSNQSSWQNALYGLPLADRFEDLWHPTPSNQSHIADYQDLLREGEAQIRDPDLDFIFIHMPVPHPPGIFHAPEASGGALDYLGNLLLADQAMGAFRRAVAATPAASHTVLIVSSDHSWRVSTWRGASDWTPAEERATSGGVFDQRPVLMVHFPGSSTGDTINQPESALVLHSLLLDLFAGRVHTAADWKAALLSGDQMLPQK